MPSWFLSIQSCGDEKTLPSPVHRFAVRLRSQTSQLSNQMRHHHGSRHTGIGSLLYREAALDGGACRATCQKCGISINFCLQWDRLRKRNLKHVKPRLALCTPQQEPSSAENSGAEPAPDLIRGEPSATDPRAQLLTDPTIYPGRAGTPNRSYVPRCSDSSHGKVETCFHQ